jgi:hypothetical protein
MGMKALEAFRFRLGAVAVRLSAWEGVLENLTGAVAGD